MITLFNGDLDAYLADVRRTQDEARADSERRANPERCNHGVSLYDNCAPCGAGADLATEKIIWRDEVHASGYRVNALIDLLGAERLAALAPFCMYGPAYNRGVADEVHAAADCAAHGNNDSALYCITNAERYIA